MAIYIMTFLMSLLIFVSISKKKRRSLVFKTMVQKKRKLTLSKYDLAIALSAIPPMFISAVRYYVGTDYLKTYYTGFYRILDGSVIDGFEIGYYALNKAIQLFTDNVFWLFIITSVIFVGVVYKAIGDISIDVPLSIILFLVTRYYFIGMNGVRQLIALAILAYSLKYVFENKLKNFLFFVLMATSFHYTSILFVPVFFVSKLKLNFKRIAIFVAVDLAFFRIGIPLILRALAGTKYGLLVAKYDLAGIKFTIFTIVLNVLLFVIGYNVNKEKENDAKYTTCVNLQFIALLASLALQSIPLIERVYWTFSFPIIITFPYLLEGIKSKRIRKVVKWGVIAIFTVYMIYDICVLEDHGVLPYQWIFGKTPTHNSGWDWYGGRFRWK